MRVAQPALLVGALRGEGKRAATIQPLQAKSVGPRAGQRQYGHSAHSPDNYFAYIVTPLCFASQPQRIIGEARANRQEALSIHFDVQRFLSQS
jgi:hypothetical protein